MLQQLALLKGFDLDDLDPASPDFIHWQVECAKLAYADRESFYGDPDFVRVPIDTLLSDRYNAERRKLIGKQASLDLRPGVIEGFGAVIEMRRAEGARAAVGSLGAGEPTVGRVGEVIGDTVHFDIIDTAGNMVRNRTEQFDIARRARRIGPAATFCITKCSEVAHRSHPSQMPSRAYRFL